MRNEVLSSPQSKVVSPIYLGDWPALQMTIALQSPDSNTALVSLFGFGSAGEGTQASLTEHRCGGFYIYIYSPALGAFSQQSRAFVANIHGSSQCQVFCLSWPIVVNFNWREFSFGGTDISELPVRNSMLELGRWLSCYKCCCFTGLELSSQHHIRQHTNACAPLQPLVRLCGIGILQSSLCTIIKTDL